MSTFVMRFDFRSPVFGTPTADLYAAALDMAVFAEQHGFHAVSVSEHHTSENGYLPSPIILASAIAARTSRIGVSVSALIVPLYDPIWLAEDIGWETLYLIATKIQAALADAATSALKAG